MSTPSCLPLQIEMLKFTPLPDYYVKVIGAPIYEEGIDVVDTSATNEFWDVLRVQRTRISLKINAMLPKLERDDDGQLILGIKKID